LCGMENIQTTGGDEKRRARKKGASVGGIGSQIKRWALNWGKKKDDGQSTSALNLIALEK